MIIFGRIFNSFGFACLLSCLLLVSMHEAVGAEANNAGADTDISMLLAELTASSPLVHKKPSQLVAEREEKTATNTKKPKSTKREGPKRISIDFYKVDLHNVFRLLGEVSKKNIVVDEGVKGTLTLALQDVPWTFVLQVIKNLKGLASHEINNTIMIYPVSKKMTWEAGDIDVADALNFEVVNPEEVSGLTIETSGQASKARNRLTPASPEQISQAGRLISMAEEAERKGLLDKAEKLLKQAISIWPDNPDLLKKAATIALKNDDEINGYNFAKQALDISPDDSAAATIAAVALARMNKASEAKTYFEKALSGNNPDLDTLWNYAVFLFSHNNFRGALRLITRIEANYSLTPDLMMMKARSYEELHRLNRAIDEYRSIITAGRNVPPDMVQYAKNRLVALGAAGGMPHGVVKY